MAAESPSDRALEMRRLTASWISERSAPLGTSSRMYHARSGACGRGLVAAAEGTRAAGGRVALRGFTAVLRRDESGAGALRAGGCGCGGAEPALKGLSGSCITLRTTQ